MQKIINFILGHVTLSITAPPEKALNILMLYNINYWNLRRAEEGITVTIPWSEQRYVRELLTQFSLSHQTAKQGGIPPTILRYRRRPGLFVGFLVFATLLWTANMFVWDIDIYGNESVSDTEILEGLRDAGAYVGAFRPNMNLDEMINTFLLNSESISWITINFMGTTAEVQVVEYRTKETAPPQDDVPSIIVAEREGIVWRYEITGGAVMVQLGQAVQPGQL
ncbi:MAG: sporulation protein YqfD, partial [Oscillospiraceae bacterium]|nr:sporulation protein YqfD [Oscillospiraceae bacterium]